jgi:hypothetical protein
MLARLKLTVHVCVCVSIGQRFISRSRDSEDGADRKRSTAVSCSVLKKCGWFPFLLSWDWEGDQRWERVSLGEGKVLRQQGGLETEMKERRVVGELV